MKPPRRLVAAISLLALAAVGSALVMNSANAEAPNAPALVSATILSNNYKQGERSTVQYTFNQRVTLNGLASSYLHDFTLGSLGRHPVAAAVESNGFVVEADFAPSLNIGLFENASVAAGAVVSTTGSVPNAADKARLTITTEGATSAPDLRGANAQQPPVTNQIIYYFDKPIESVDPSSFGYYVAGNATPVMGTDIPSGGFTPGSTAVTIDFPGTTAPTASAEFVLNGAVTGATGLSSPEGYQGGNVSGVPGLLSASGEWIASVTQANTKTYDFTFNQAPSAATASDFFLYSATGGRFTGSTATVSGQTAEVTFPTLTASTDIVQSAVAPGAITAGGLPSTAGQEPVGPAAGYFTGTAANRGVGFTPTGASIKSSPATLRDAPCGPGDSPESGLQGQVPVSVRSAFKGFNCNLSELGQYPSAGVTWFGGTWVGSWAGTCVYLSTMGHGTYVVDASDPSAPVTTELLTTPAFLHTWESLKYNPARHLLAATSAHDPFFDIYDVSDCAHPKLDASLNLGPIDNGHAGNWAPDGKTYYGTQFYRGVGGVIAIIDTTDPTAPKLLENYPVARTGMDPAGDGRPHDLSLNRSGTIAYINQPGQFGNNDFPGPNGLVMLNVSQVQHRVANPRISLIGTLFWNDSGQGQQSLPVTYDGQQYMITTDEIGAGGVGGRAGACARGLSPFGFTRLINVNDPRHAYIVSKLRLEVDNPTKCAITDDAPNTGSFGYDSHYCNVNRLNNPTMLGCGYFESGLRLFDISNPQKPSEIGYFNPPPGHGTDSEHANSSPVGFTETDWGSSPPVFVGCNIWDQFQDNGYMFLKITHGPAKRLCTVDSGTANSSLQ